MLDKNYRPAEAEQAIYSRWEETGAFAANPDSPAKPYCIMIPPPNVTGSLHMGHALNNTLQDILARYKRMQGFDVLWQPGTDHAGIATQMVVERQLEAKGLTRHDLGREKFIEKVWEWKAQSGGVITSQLRRLGSSCDWSRERFTMDHGLSMAVAKVFVELYKQGMIRRDKRLVNWDPLLHTAISGLEVEQRETTGQMFRFKYPLQGDKGAFIIVATTRPETMLGDTAVAVHPSDVRYAHLVGQNCILPIVNRKIPIIADEYADPEKGSGAVKITPAHDFNDFEVGKRHGLAMINVLDQNACMNENAPERYLGLDRFEARDAIVKEMEGLGLLDGIEENQMAIPHGDRSGVVIEPWLTDQWFVDAKALAKPAIEAVQNGRIKFIPENWAKTYFEWMSNIEQWCVSRQIWWGHQIPAWFGPDGHVFVELTEQQAMAKATRHYGGPVALKRDEDVLDTWFSSALWPFSTLGWPDGGESRVVERYYPTDALVTGFDIIFFWVARMIMCGLHFMKGQVPFRTVYIHALVRDEHGQKMSKSKGNIIDPLLLIDKYGADALRFTLAAMAAQGRDIKLAESRVEGYRNFITKLWNAARFCQMNECREDASFNPRSCRLTINRWIISKAGEAALQTKKNLDAYKFNEAAAILYQFTWGTFCDWYLEFIKPVLYGHDEAAKAETCAASAFVFDRILSLLHPFIPFVTEELWSKTASRESLLIKAPWFTPGQSLIDGDAMEEMDWVVRLIAEIRSVRSEMNVPPAAKLELFHRGAGLAAKARLAAHKDQIMQLARVFGLEESAKIGQGCLQLVLDEATFIMPLAGVIDIEAEQARLAREIAKLDAEIAKAEKKLADERFTAKAPPEVVETNRQRLEEDRQARAKRKEAAQRLASL